MSPSLRLTAIGQGLYYAITGLWPVVHMPSFVLITGPKREHWLVRTVGLLLAVIGCTLTSSGLRQRIQPETVFLGVGSALSLASIDIIYWKRGRLRFVFLLDALVELGLVGAWMLGWSKRALMTENPEIGLPAKHAPV